MASSVGACKSATSDRRDGGVIGQDGLSGLFGK